MFVSTVKSTLYLVFVLVLLSIATLGRPSVAPSVEANARDAVARFVSALDALDVERFIDCFSPDATIFYPQPGALKRIDGQRQIRSSIEVEFDAARTSLAAAGITRPPFLKIVPLDMKVQVLSDDSAVVTWHVDRKTHGGRRTAVVQRQGARWVMVSLHSSNMTYE